MKDFTTDILVKINEEQERVSKAYKNADSVEEKKILFERAEELKKRRVFHEGVLERRKPV